MNHKCNNSDITSIIHFPIHLRMYYNYTDVTVGFVTDYDVVEGSGVSVEVAVLNGVVLDREVVVMVATSDDNAEGT